MAKTKAKPAKTKAEQSSHGPASQTTIPHFLVHDREDNVGVVVIEGLEAGTAMLGVITADNSDLNVAANHDIPIGHKVALTDFKKGDTVMKYGVDIGKIIKAAKKGDHIHTHNLKTKRW
ncbi:MAG: UxaA family hydrolase [Pseudomonadota bacterium]